MELKFPSGIYLNPLNLCMGLILISSGMAFACSEPVSSCGASTSSTEDYFNFVESECLLESKCHEISCNVEKAMQERKTALRRCLIHSIPEVLQNVWTESPTLNKTEAQKLYKLYFQKYSSILYQIYLNTIDEVYNLEDFNGTQLPQHIYHTYQQGNLDSLQMTLKLHLRLYSKYIKSADKHSAFILQLVHYLNLIKNDKVFGQLNANLRNRLNTVFSEMPSSIVQFLYKPFFCLRNALYGKFLYTTVVGGFESGKYKKIFIWESDESVSLEGRWIQKETAEGFLIRGDISKYYMYIEKKKRDIQNQITSWGDADQIPPNSYWRIEFIGNYMLLRQDDGLAMCASEKKYDAHRRYVYGEEKDGSSMECLWTVESC